MKDLPSQTLGECGVNKLTRPLTSTIILNKRDLIRKIQSLNISG